MVASNPNGGRGGKRAPAQRKEPTPPESSSSSEEEESSDDHKSDIEIDQRRNRNRSYDDLDEEEQLQQDLKDILADGAFGVE